MERKTKENKTAIDSGEIFVYDGRIEKTASPRHAQNLEITQQCHFNCRRSHY